MAAKAFFEANAEIRASSDLSVKSITISRTKNRDILLNLPHQRSRKFNFIYEHPPIADLLERAEQRGNAGPRLILHAEEVEDVLRDLADAGVKFFTSGKPRTWANGYSSVGRRVAKECVSTCRSAVFR